MTSDLELALCLQGHGDGLCSLHSERVSLQPQGLETLKVLDLLHYLLHWRGGNREKGSLVEKNKKMGGDELQCKALDFDHMFLFTADRHRQLTLT